MTQLSKIASLTDLPLARPPTNSKTSARLRGLPTRRTSFTPLGESPIGVVQLGAVVRALLWDCVRCHLFSASPGSVREIWTTAPIGGDADQMPEDVVALLEGWFGLVESSDVQSFLASVAAKLPSSRRARFIDECNAVLGEAGSSFRLSHDA